MLTYYDHISGQTRLKPRYKYAALAFIAGILVGALLAAVF